MNLNFPSHFTLEFVNSFNSSESIISSQVESINSGALKQKPQSNTLENIFLCPFNYCLEAAHGQAAQLPTSSIPKTEGMRKFPGLLHSGEHVVHEFLDISR
jgi:hypothetical protein